MVDSGLLQEVSVMEFSFVKNPGSVERTVAAVVAFTVTIFSQFSKPFFKSFKAEQSHY